MNWLSQGAMPMGMLFFAGLVFATMRRKAGNVLAAKQYPQLAKRLGLEYRPSQYKTGVGTIVGTYEGFSVIVDPDDQRRIRVRFETEPAVDLRNYEQRQHPPQGAKEWFGGDRKFDSFFKTRFLGPAETKALQQLDEPSSLVAELRMIREMKQLNVTPAGVSAVFDYGHPSYIPASVVEGVLPLLVRIARVFEDPRAVEPLN